MSSNQIEKDRSCALQVLEGHKPEDYRLSRFEQPAPLITSNLHHETSPHDSASTQASSTSSIWSGIIPQRDSSFSRTTSLTPSIKSHKRQQSASSLTYLHLQKPLPPLPPDEPSPSPTSNDLQNQVSKLCFSPSNSTPHQKDLVLPDHHSPLISPALSNFTTSSKSSYASHLCDNPVDPFREDIRVFHPRSQSSCVTTATLDTGSDCCCIRVDILSALSIPLSSSLIRPTTLSTKGISGAAWQPLGRILLSWRPFRGEGEAHNTWFFVGDMGLPFPVLLGKDFLLERGKPPRVVAVLVNVLNKPSKEERGRQREEERRHRVVVRENERVKEGRMAVVQAFGSRSRSSLGSETGSEKSVGGKTL